MQVTVLFPEQFDSALEGEASGEFIWPVREAEIPAFDTEEAARSQGAVDADSTLIRLNFRSSFTERVTIQQIEVVVKEATPLRGVWATGDKGGGANVRYLHVDLDAATVQWVDQNRTPIAPLAVYVTDTEEENVDVLATANDCYCQWTLRVTYTAGGAAPSVLTVTPPGRDRFHTSATDAAAILQPEPDGCTESPIPGPQLCS